MTGLIAENKRIGLSSNSLKLLALFTMTIDHVGVILYPHMLILRIIGRLAFPIFAYMIAEGFRHTKNPKHYFCFIFILGLLLQIIYFFFTHSLYQSVLISFSFSISLMYLTHLTIKKKISIVFLPLTFLTVYFISEVMPKLTKSDFEIDYGFFGIILPVLVFISTNYFLKLVFLSFGLILLSISIGGIQWYSLLSVLPLAFYNRKRGRLSIKWFFYIYYPLHLGVLQLISFLINFFKI